MLCLLFPSNLGCEATLRIRVLNKQREKRRRSTTRNTSAVQHSTFAARIEICSPVLRFFTDMSLIDMAERRQNKPSEAKLKTTGNALALGPQIPVIHRKQTSHYINA
jgi:hypothetical protein